MKLTDCYQHLTRDEKRILHIAKSKDLEYYQMVVANLETCKELSDWQKRELETFRSKIHVLKNETEALTQ